eukprot:1139182-Pelagomonas_calceolata.AAC.1
MMIVLSKFEFSQLLIPVIRNMQRLDPQRTTKLERELHAHFVQHAHKLTSTKRAIENENTPYKSGALGPRAAKDPANPHWLPPYPLVRETHSSLSQWCFGGGKELGAWRWRAGEGESGHPGAL